MLVGGAFMRFVKNGLSKNITQEQGDWRKLIGKVLLVIGFIIAIITITLQATLPDTVADYRYWRLLVGPCWIGAYSYYKSGDKCLCSGLAARGVYMRPGEKKTWKDIFYQKNKDENKIIDEYAANKLKWEGRKLTIESFIYGSIATVILLVLPPGDDIYGDVL